VRTRRADLAAAVRYPNVMVARARGKPTRSYPRARLIHYRVNPPRVPIVCEICGRVAMRCQSELAPGQRRHCSTVCKLIGGSLWPPRAQVSAQVGCSAKK
jgi:hypothetical protein